MLPSIPLKIYKENIDQVSEEEYALLRKKTFGASDVAVLFNHGFKTKEDLFAEKKCPTLTEEEKAIGQLPSVRKGKDLEPLIRKKYEDAAHETVFKPIHMYEIMPGLTVNFDGINNYGLPVEFKYVTTFGTKHWNRILPEIFIRKEPFTSNKQNITDYIKEQADYYGIPPYYYTQVQTQIMALNAKAGIICALFEKDWELQAYYIHADERFAKALKIAVALNWPEIHGTEIPKIDESTFEY